MGRGGAVSAIAVYHHKLEGGGLLAVALHGRMPMLLHPDLILAADQGFGNILLAYSALGGMYRELCRIIGKPDNLCGLGTGKETMVVHRLIELLLG